MSRPLKILIFSNSCAYDNNWGYSIVGSKLARGLAKKGYSVYYFGMQDLHPPYKDNEGIVWLGVRSCAFGSDVLQDYCRIYGIDILITIFDVFVQQASYIPQMVKDLGMKWICHITLNSEPLSHVIRQRIEKADLIIAPSDFNEKLLVEGGFRAKTWKIYHGVDTGVFKKESEQERKRLRQQMNIPENTFVAGFVGRNNGSQKNFAQLFEAWGLFLKWNPSAKDKALMLVLTDPLETGQIRLDYMRLFTGLNDNLKFILAKPSPDHSTVELTYEGDPAGMLHHPNLNFSNKEMNKFYNLLDIFVTASQGESFCLAPGTEIITSNGPKMIEEVAMNDLVLSHTGEFNRISQIMSREFKGEVINIRTYGQDKDIVITPNHNVLVYRTRKLFKKQDHKCLGWIPASEIKKGDILVLPKIKGNCEKLVWDMKSVVPRVNCSEKEVWLCLKYSSKLQLMTRINMNRYLDYDEDMAKLIGWYLAEGDCANLTTVGFSLHAKEKEYQQEIRDCMKRKFGTVDYCESFEGNRYSISFSSALLSHFFSKLFGRGAKNKKIPMSVINGDEELLRIVMDRLFKGDGHFVKSQGIYTLSTSSKNIAQESKIALIRLGYQPTLRNYARMRSYHSEDKFLSEEYCVSYYPYKKVIQSIKSLRIGENFVGYRVRKISSNFYEGLVYNFSVNKDETYCTTSFVVHNCLPSTESFACQVPCVGFDFSAVKDHITNSGAGRLASVYCQLPNSINSYVIIGNSSDMARQIEFYYKYPNIRAEDGKKGVKYAETLNWDKIIDRWELAVREVERRFFEPNPETQNVGL